MIPFRICPVCHEKFLTKALWMANTFPAAKDSYRIGYTERLFASGAVHRTELPIEISYRRHDGCTGVMGDEGQEFKIVAPDYHANRSKELCKKGHALTGDNVGLKKQAKGGPMRVCKECARMAAARKRSSLKVAV